MVAFTWFVFIINPFIGTIFVLIGLYKDRKNSIHYSVMCALFFAALAYWFIPNHEMDLTRYFSQLVIYSNLSLENFVNTVLSRNILIVQELLFYGIAKTNNFHLLPAIVIFITYFLTFYMITNYSNRKNVESKRMMKVILFVVCVLPFPSLVSNIRNILAFVLFIYAVYRDIEQNKMNLLTYLLYLAPIFIHISTVALLIIRLLLPLYQNSKKKMGIALGMISATFLINKVSNLVQNSILGSNRIINSFFTKANNYVNNTDSAYAQYLLDNTFMNLQKAYFVAVIALLLLMIFIINKNIKAISRSKDSKSITETTKLISFTSLMSLIVLGTTPIVLTVYMRFVFPTIILSFIVILNKDLYVKKKIHKEIFSIGLFIAAIGGILHQVAFTYKMTDIFNMVTSVMVRSLLNMFLV